MLLILSFIYTSKVVGEARNKDPLMKSVANYKKENDVKPKQGQINGDELILGISGLSVNKIKSYKNMKKEDMFNDKKIKYDKKYPKISVTNNYDYYIVKGNNKKNYVSIIFKVNSNKNLNNILALAKKENVVLNFFVDGYYLDKNVDNVFRMNKIKAEIYNGGYNGNYSKNTITHTNNLIESITLKKSKICLNEYKNNDEKIVCKKNKMISISPKIVNPSILDVKNKLDKGQMLLFNLEDYDTSKFSLLVNTIKSRGYEIKELSILLKEDN